MSSKTRILQTPRRPLFPPCARCFVSYRCGKLTIHDFGALNSIRQRTKKKTILPLILHRLRRTFPLSEETTSSELEGSMVLVLRNASASEFMQKHIQNFFIMWRCCTSLKESIMPTRIPNLFRDSEETVAQHRCRCYFL